MIFTATPVAGAFPDPAQRHEDERGFFARTYCVRELAEHGLDPQVVQRSVSYNSRRGTLRGMHYQAPPHEENKLVSCSQGAIYDVIVDLRPASPSYQRWHASTLTADNRDILFVPEGAPTDSSRPMTTGRRLPDVRVPPSGVGQGSFRQSGLRDQVAPGSLGHQLARSRLFSLRVFFRDVVGRRPKRPPRAVPRQLLLLGRPFNQAMGDPGAYRNQSQVEQVPRQRAAGCSAGLTAEGDLIDLQEQCLPDVQTVRTLADPLQRSGFEEPRGGTGGTESRREHEERATRRREPRRGLGGPGESTLRAAPGTKGVHGTALHSAARSRIRAQPGQRRRPTTRHHNGYRFETKLQGPRRTILETTRSWRQEHAIPQPRSPQRWR